MGLVIFILLVCWCFVVPPALCWMGKVGRLTVFFWVFFGLTAFINATAINFLYHDSDLDNWMGLVGPILMILPFAFMLYIWERRNRKPLLAVLIAFLGSLPVTALWLLTSMMFMG